MSAVMPSSRIPYAAAAGGVRWDPVTGCNHLPGVCEVKDRFTCWAQADAQKRVCEQCMKETDSFICKVGHPCGIGGMASVPCPKWQEAFTPAFHADRLDVPLRTKLPRLILVGFGGDMWSPGIDPDWRKQVHEVETQCLDRGKGHVFVHLTKNPHAMEPGYWGLPNQWMGLSCTDDRAYHLIEELDANCGSDARRWVSFEPVLSMIHPSKCWQAMADWLRRFRVEFVVIGGLSDGRGRIMPPTEPEGLRVEWALTIIRATQKVAIPFFCKNLHLDVWTKLGMQGPRELRELPPEWEALRRKESK